MSMGSRREKFPWLALLLLLASVFVFWVVPWLQKDRPIALEFVDAPKSKAN